MSWYLLLQRDVIASPCAPSGRGRVCSITWVGWSVTVNNLLALLLTYQPPPPSYLSGTATISDSALRGRPWGDAATLAGWVPPPPPPSGLHVSRARPWEVASFTNTATSSPLLPHYDLHGP